MFGDNSTEAQVPELVDIAESHDLKRIAKLEQ
jgi:hypothetical protein